MRKVLSMVSLLALCLGSTSITTWIGASFTSS
jgi:hypothetical protein